MTPLAAEPPVQHHATISLPIKWPSRQAWLTLVLGVWLAADQFTGHVQFPIGVGAEFNPPKLSVEWRGWRDSGHPKPKPVPPVPPQPPKNYALPLHATLVYDPTATTPDLATVKIGLGIRKAFAGLQADYHTVESTATDEVNAKWLGSFTSEIAKAGVPCVILHDHRGVFIEAVKPTSEDAVVNAVKEARGK